MMYNLNRSENRIYTSRPFKKPVTLEGEGEVFDTCMTEWDRGEGSN